jgi:hypothetical protein
MTKTPKQQVTEGFGGKEQLVDKILPLLEKVVGRGEETKEALKKRLGAVASSNLLRLERTLGEIDRRFGGRDKLADAYVKLVGRVKDADFRKAVERYTPGKLLDVYRSAERRLSRKNKAA